MTEPLEHEHTVEAIAQRLKAINHHTSLGDFVLGAVDGTITTFAIVSGVAGAGLPAGIAVVLGLANVLADGFSMAVGNYLKTRSDEQITDRYRRIEEKHIARVPEGEKEEIRQIYAAKGFTGDTLEEVVRVITSDRRRWVDAMLADEWGLPTSAGSAVRTGVITFLAFVLAGLVPLAPLLFAGVLSATSTFLMSAAATAVTFLFIGAVRGRTSQQSVVVSALETLLIGGIAASLAFGVGALFRQFVGSGGI